MPYTRSWLLSIPATALSLLTLASTSTMASPMPFASPVLPTSSSMEARYIQTFDFVEEKQVEPPTTMMMGTTTTMGTAVLPTSAGFTAYENIVSTFSPSIGSSDHSIASSSEPSTMTTTMITPSATAVAVSVAAPAAPTTALPLPVPFPQPFDQSLSYSLTDSCVAFLATYLGSEEMRGAGSRTTTTGTAMTGVGRCGRPFGLLMSSSSGWATIARNETLLTAALSQICYPTSSSTTTTTSTTDDDCSDYYRSLVADVQKSSNCGTDLKRKNPVALEALYGFQNYDMLQRAACLTDTETHAYCYVQAMSTVSAAPDDGYLYQLPVGISLPSTSRPTCSSCSAKLINLFTETIVNATTLTTTTSTSTSGGGGSIVKTSSSSSSSSSATMTGQLYSYAPVLQNTLTNTTVLVKQVCGSTFAGQITTMQAHVSSSARASVLRVKGSRSRSLKTWWSVLGGGGFRLLSVCVGVLVTVFLESV